MRKIFTLFTMLTASLSADIGSDCNTCFDVYVPNLESAFELNGGFLYMQPSAGNLGWGVVTHSLPVETPNWHIKTIKPRFHPGFSVECRYIFGSCGTDTKFAYEHLNTSDSESVRVTPDKDWISPFCQTDSGVNLLTKAHARARFFYDALNFDLGINVNIGPRLRIRFFSGVKGACIRETLESFFKHPSALTKIKLDNTSNYTGVGPRIGFNSAFKICHNFNFLSELGAAILLGSLKPAEYHFKGYSESLEKAKQHISSTSTFHSVPSLDLKLGLQYILTMCNWFPIRFEAGYRSATYIDAISGYETATNVLPLDLGSLSTNSMKHIESTFTVNGPYFTMSLEF